MKKYKILFLDIDGTVLTPEDTIEPSTKEAIKQVQEKGIEVFLATGRPLHEISVLGKELQIHSFIGYNGAYAINKGEDIFQEPMDAHTVQHFLDIAKAKGHEVILYTNGKNAVTSFESENVAKFLKKFDFKQNVLFQSDLIHDVLGITVVNLEKKDIALYEKNHNIHLSSVNVEGFVHHAFDVIRDNINKGFAVQHVLNLLGFHKEEAIAFGDAMNDKEMLSIVGEGFAMGNAHPDLFQYANNKTTDVTNSGVFNGLKKLGLVE